MNANTASKAYAKIGFESGIAAADPHMLIAMLYQGALLAIANARNGILGKNIAGKCAAVSKAIQIIDEGLNASLDMKAGGDLAQNLSSLYEYMVIRLTQANLNDDVAALDEVARLLNDLKGAWDSLRQVGAAPAATQTKAVHSIVPREIASGENAAPSMAAPPKAANKVQRLYGGV